MAQNVSEIFANLKSYFNKGGLDKDMTIYFSIGDEKWTVAVGPDSCEVSPGKTVDQADLVLKTSPRLFTRMMLEGWTPGVSDFVMGKVKSNDPNGLLALKKAFNFPGG